MANSARTRLNPDCAKHGICSSDDFTAACLGKAPLVIRNVQTDRRTRKPEFFACNSLVSYIGAPLLVKDQWLAIGLLGAGFTSYEIEFFGSLMTRSLIALNAILSPVLALRTAPWDNSGQVLENGFNFSRRRQRKSAPPELTLRSQGYKSARRYRAASSAWCRRKGLNDHARLSPYAASRRPNADSRTNTTTCGRVATERRRE